MKKVNLYELFGHLDSKDVLLTDIKSDSVNCDEEKIRNDTQKSSPEYEAAKAGSIFTDYETTGGWFRLGSNIGWRCICGGI